MKKITIYILLIIISGNIIACDNELLLEPTKTDITFTPTIINALILPTIMSTPTGTPTPQINCKCPDTPINGQCVSPYQKMFINLDNMIEEGKKEGENIQLTEIPTNINLPKKILPIEKINGYTKPEDLNKGEKYLFIDLLTYEEYYNKYSVADFIPLSRDQMIYFTGLYQPKGACSRGGYDKPFCVPSALILNLYNADTGEGLSYGFCEINAELNDCLNSKLLRCP